VGAISRQPAIHSRRIRVVGESLIYVPILAITVLLYLWRLFMNWNPTAAEKILDASANLKFEGEGEKLRVYTFPSGREIALLTENLSKVSVYGSTYPRHIAEVKLTTSYAPTRKKSGRHSNLEYMTRTLGFAHSAFLLNVTTGEGFQKFLKWYQHA
jgi:hypothetical protein